MDDVNERIKKIIDRSVADALKEIYSKYGIGNDNSPPVDESFSYTCEVCKHSKGICLECQNKYSISLGKMEAVLNTSLNKVGDELSFSQTVVQNNRLGNFIGDLDKSEKYRLDNSQGIVSWRRGFTLHFIYSDTLSYEKLLTIANHYNEKMQALELKEDELRERDRIIKESARLRKEQLLVVQKSLIHNSRTAKCFRCSNRLSTESHLICNVCKWIECDCGACKCNYVNRF